MIDEIVKSTREASAVLDRIKSMPCEGLEKEVILPLLRKAVNLKLMIQEDTQTDIRKLVIISIKRQDLRKGNCLLYTSPSPRDGLLSRMPSSA